MALTRNKKPATTRPVATPEVEAALNTTQSRHFKPRTGISGSPATRTVQMFARLAIDGVRDLPKREVETATCNIYRWRNGKLVVVRKVERPKTLASGYKGRMGLPKAREGSFELLDELFDYAIDSDGYQASESVLRALLEAWVAQHGDRLSGNERLYLARAFGMVMAGRSGVDIASTAGVA